MFTFNGVSNEDMQVQVYGITRAVKPKKRVVKTVIPGRNGTYNTTDDTFEPFTISMKCAYTGDNAPAVMRHIAAWLQGSGALVFDDEPDKNYQATAWAIINANRNMSIREFTINFDCFPFASSAAQQVEGVVQSSTDAITANVQGTAPTPCRIIITNLGDTTITQLRITHSVD